MFKLSMPIPFIGILLTLCLYNVAADAQTLKPWTGSVVGATISVNNDQSLALIKELINEGDTEGAVREANKLVNRLKQNELSGEETGYKYDAYNALCLSLTANNDLDEAMKACNKAIQNSPGRWQAINSRGSLNFKIGNFEQALSDYKEALNRAPDATSIKRILEHNIKIAEIRSSGN